MTRPTEEAARSYPLGWLRDQFPALSAANGDRIFLDNASGSQVPQGVIDAAVRTMVEMNVNKGGAYRASQRVTAAKEGVRERVAEFLGAPSAQRQLRPERHDAARAARAGGRAHAGCGR